MLGGIQQTLSSNDSSFIVSAVGIIDSRFFHARPLWYIIAVEVYHERGAILSASGGTALEFADGRGKDAV